MGVAILAALVFASGAQAAQVPVVKVLSSRADLVSAGDALVAVKLPKGSDPSDLTVHAGKRDVTGAFALRPNGRVEGLVKGLGVGRNVLTARVAGGRGARIVLTNHSNGGPLFSGPQVQPWVCQDTAKDRKCNEPAEVEYQYKSAAGEFLPYNPKSPPSDVTTTKTDQGKTVPYIVRRETGYQDRDQYAIAALDDPAHPTAPWSRNAHWNHKLLITHGASCGIEREAGSAPDVMADDALSRGFAVMSTALDNAGHNCNIVTQAESLAMAKERVVELFGPIRYTIARGCSGGSLTQQQVANAYPGIYQGLTPQCSFPDGWSTGQQLSAYHLTRLYFENPSKWGLGVAWTPDQIAEVEGHPNHVNAAIFDSIYWTDLGVPDDGCTGVPAEQTYNPTSNPGGVRCTLADYMINVLGPRRRSDWSANEQKIGHGFAGLPLDDVGVQFGLRALRQGRITPAQFVDLNEKIGGVTVDIRPVQRRFRANQPALQNAYRSGAINEGNNLAGVPIIDLRGPDPGAFHDAYRTWTMRARLERHQGHFPKNHVIWFGHVALVGDANYASEAFLAVDRWLARVEKDKRPISRERKVAEDRPEDIQDRCSQIPGVEAVDVPGLGQVCKQEQVQTRYATPAMVAGEGIRTDTNKCRLKRLLRTDYYPVEFSDDQWSRLKNVFPTGVCNWARSGVSQRGAIPWLTYQKDARGKHVIYGGRPLGKAPRSRALK
ncbi:MAG TPA: DUF6351 family protein [Thermoleophilaceae bacterium]|nr:DUF6351 family protein [Thermoleophilaceae bacterium]